MVENANVVHLFVFNIVKTKNRKKKVLVSPSEAQLDIVYQSCQGTYFLIQLFYICPSSHDADGIW